MARELIEVRTFAGRSRWVLGRCDHDAAVPVYSVSREYVARLCLDCDTQLPPPPPSPREQQ